MSDKMVEYVRKAIRESQQNAHVTLWSFPSINDRKNVADTERLFEVFTYDKDSNLFIDGKKYRLGIKYADDKIGGWVVLFPLSVPKVEKQEPHVVLPHRTEEEYKAWWRENNPHMLNKMRKETE